MPKISQQQKTMPAALVRKRDKELSTDNKTETSGTVALCSNVSPWHRALAAWWRCWQAWALCSALVGQVWRLCFWRVPAADFLLLVLAETGDWIHREQGQAGPWNGLYCVAGKRANSQNTPETVHNFQNHLGENWGGVEFLQRGWVCKNIFWPMNVT